MMAKCKRIDGQRRETGRRRVVFKGEVRLLERKFECVVRDISSTGAQLAAKQTLSRGAPFHLHLPRFGTFPCVVAWVKEGLMGVVFVDGDLGSQQRFGEKAALLGLLDAAPDRG